MGPEANDGRPGMFLSVRLSTGLPQWICQVPEVFVPVYRTLLKFRQDPEGLSHYLASIGVVLFLAQIISTFIHGSRTTGLDLLRPVSWFCHVAKSLSRNCWAGITFFSTIIPVGRKRRKIYLLAT